MFKSLYEAIKETHGEYFAESFTHFAEGDGEIKQKLENDLEKGIEFCLKIIQLALSGRK